MITLRSAGLTVDLDPDRGGEICGIRTPDGRNLLAFHEWDAPLSVDDGPRYGSTELDWLSRYRAGWQVLFPNAGAESVVDGVPVAFHGETSQARMQVVEVGDDCCRLRTAARLPLTLERTVRVSPDRRALLIEETAENVGSRPVPLIWGHHPTFPAVPGARIDLPASAAVHVEPATPGPLVPTTGTWPLLQRADGTNEDVSSIPDAEQVRLLYVESPAEGWAALRSADDRPSIALSWDRDTFSHLWLWLQNADPGYPWYGRARMIGIEPQRSWPFDGLAPAHQRGQAIVLEPGETHSSWVTLAVFDGADGAVTGVDRSGAVTTG